MKNLKLNKHINNEMESILESALKQIAGLYGEKIDCSDTGLQAVFDLKSQAIDSLEQLGLKINTEL